MTETYEDRPTHDPNDVRGGGGPPGAPDSWPTSKPQFGPLREGKPNVIYPEGHPLHREPESDGAEPQPPEATQPPQGPEVMSMTPDAQLSPAPEQQEQRM